MQPEIFHCTYININSSLFMQIEITFTIHAGEPHLSVRTFQSHAYSYSWKGEKLKMKKFHVHITTLLKTPQYDDITEHRFSPHSLFISSKFHTKSPLKFRNNLLIGYCFS